MDAPWILALIAFFGIFLMFVIISLLADLLIIGAALGCAAAAYFMPSWYPLFFEFIQDTQLPVYLGLKAPLEGGGLEQMTLYTMVGLLVFLGTLICIPALPFSATYRQVLGANKIGKRDEVFVRALVRSELDDFNQASRKSRSHKSRRPPAPEPEDIKADVAPEEPNIEASPASLQSKEPK